MPKIDPKHAIELFDKFKSRNRAEAQSRLIEQGYYAVVKAVEISNGKTIVTMQYNKIRHDIVVGHIIETG